MIVRIWIILCVAILTNVDHTFAQRQNELPWYVPSHAKVQFAGNIGMFSVGPGYRLRNPNWEIDLKYGYVPAAYASDPIHSFTLKASWGTLDRNYRDIDITWLKFGAWHNHSFGQNYFRRLPEYYEKGYYYFSTAINFGMFYATELRYRRTALYMEIGTSDKHVINYVKNPYSVDFSDLWNIGLGLKYYIKAL